MFVSRLKKIILTTLKVVLVLYVILCGLLYFFQEHLIFFPQRLDKHFQFHFNQPFEEQNINTPDGGVVNGILFKSDSTKGLIFYLHGNAGCLNTWGNVAKVYTDLHYDVFIMDYPGYGKSGGKITSQHSLFDAIQAAYNEQRKHYDEQTIIVLGYSIGTGMAAKVASTNHPKLLILQAPYYSLTDMMRHTYPFIPTFILKYELETNEYLKACKMPVVIFHGDQDHVIYYGSSLKLKNEFKPADTLITLPLQGHNGITEDYNYKAEMARLLK